MAIKTVRKRIKHGQAIMDLKFQIRDSINVINSAILNIETAIDSMKDDPDFNLDEMQEFKNVLLYGLTECDKAKKKCSEIYDSIILG